MTKILIEEDTVKQVLNALLILNSPSIGARIRQDNAIDDLREALAEQQEPVVQAWSEGYRAGVEDERTSEANIGIAGMGMKVEPARNNPYLTSPQPAQQMPDDWFKDMPEEYRREAWRIKEQPAQQEPWGAFVDGRVFVGRLPEHVRKFSENAGVPIQWLYTSPLAQRTWVGLTDEEIDTLREANSEGRGAGWRFNFKGFARAIEAKLRRRTHDHSTCS